MEKVIENFVELHKVYFHPENIKVLHLEIDEVGKIDIHVIIEIVDLHVEDNSIKKNYVENYVVDFVDIKIDQINENRYFNVELAHY